MLHKKENDTLIRVKHRGRDGEDNSATERVKRKGSIFLLERGVERGRGKINARRRGRGIELKGISGVT